MFPSPVNQKEIVLTPTVDTAAYASGDSILAAAIKVPAASRGDGGNANLMKVVIADAAAQLGALDIIFFNKQPSAQVINTAFTPTAADQKLIVGRISIASGDIVSYTGAKEATKEGNPLLNMKTANSSNLWMALVARSTPTFTALSVQITLLFNQN